MQQPQNANFRVFVYLFSGRQEETLPNWDDVRLENGFQPNLFGRFRDEFLEVDPEPEIIMIGANKLLNQFFNDYECGVAYVPEYPDFRSHGEMISQSNIFWKSGDWVFKLIRLKGGKWVIQGGQYNP